MMYYCTFALLFLAVCLPESYCQNFDFSRPRIPLSMCTQTLTKPCKLRINARHLNGSYAGHVRSPGCRCSHTQDCPTNWNDPDHAISQELMSFSRIMRMKMIFCEPIAPRNFCGLGETALIMRGSMEIPTTIHRYICRCSGDVPLRLKVRELRNYMFYQEYVCDNSMPTCPLPISPCMQSGNMSVTYNCKCPGRQRCLDDPNADPFDNPLYGYCRD